MSETPAPDRVDRLLDAIDHIKANRREEACTLLRDLISEDGDSEEAWLWMSVAVESLDQSAVCLENVLRVNPKNTAAAGALYRLRFSEIEMEKQRAHIRLWRDLALSGFWLLVTGLMLLFLCSLYSGIVWLLTGQPPLMAPTPLP